MPHQLQEATRSVVAEKMALESLMGNMSPSEPRVDAALALLAFKLVLPDPQGDLAIQHPLEHFTLFPKLPLELRRKIWCHSFPTGRNFVQHRIISTPMNRLPESKVYRKFHPPPIAHAINKESREEFLLHYKPAIQVLARRRVNPTGLEVTFTTVTSFFSYEKDIFHIDVYGAIRALLPVVTEPSKVERAAWRQKLFPAFVNVQNVELRCYIVRGS
ncbi:hypothetical protein B0J14DRAFT_568202 [Halenospora varia]|nr:hypothetical protein B0J14DRAFT_568202 [Halenospora varia]